MLKEISANELPNEGVFGVDLSPDGAFAEETALDFATSELMLAEVSGWPSGEPKSSKECSRKHSLLDTKVKKHKLYNIKAMQRGRRIFLQKTIIRKAGEVDG